MTFIPWVVVYKCRGMIPDSATEGSIVIILTINGIVTETYTGESQRACITAWMAEFPGEVIEDWCRAVGAGDDELTDEQMFQFLADENQDREIVWSTSENEYLRQSRGC